MEKSKAMSLKVVSYLFLLTFFLFLISFSSALKVNIPPKNITNFTQLLDTPSTYLASANYCVIVNAGETGLTFSNCSTIGSSVNSSNYWDGLDTFNTTTFEEQTGGILGIKFSWLEPFIRNVYFPNATQEFYKITNPFGFYNITDFDINDYYLLSNPLNFTNKTLLSQFENDGVFINWNQATNGTLRLTDNHTFNGDVDITGQSNLSGVIIGENVIQANGLNNLLNKGFNISTPALSQHGKAFSLANDLGMYFYLTSAVQGLITFGSSVTNYHEFSIFGASIGDVNHTDNAGHFWLWDASTSTETIGNTNVENISISQQINGSRFTVSGWTGVALASDTYIRLGAGAMSSAFGHVVNRNGSITSISCRVRQASTPSVALITIGVSKNGTQVFNSTPQQFIGLDTQNVISEEHNRNKYKFAYGDRLQVVYYANKSGTNGQVLACALHGYYDW